VLIKYGMVDRRIACDLWGGVVLECWNNMAPALAIIRSVKGTDVWQNFEYLASICQDWLDAHPNGAYPRGAIRLPTTIPPADVIAQAMPVELVTGAQAELLQWSSPHGHSANVNFTIEGML